MVVGLQLRCVRTPFGQSGSLRGLRWFRPRGVVSSRASAGMVPNPTRTPEGAYPYRVLRKRQPLGTASNMY